MEGDSTAEQVVKVRIFLPYYGSSTDKLFGVTLCASAPRERGNEIITLIGLVLKLSPQ